MKMRKVVMYIAASLDGYIADKKGGVDWLTGDGTDPDHAGSYEDFIQTVDTILLGYRTYHQIVTELAPDDWIYKGQTTYVLTHRNVEDKEAIKFTAVSIESLINDLRAQDGKDIWICGGADLIKQVLALDLVDEICVSIIPVILGDGIRLFSPNPEEKKLKLIGTRAYNGIVDLVYSRVERKK